MKNISKNSMELNFKTRIDSILTNLEASLLTLSFQMEDITNAILFGSRNILHPAILPPKQLYKELVDNYRHLPADVTLPVSLELRNIYKLLNVSSISCFSLNTKIVFVIRLPLVSPKLYDLYHNIALPTPHDDVKPDTFSLIRPSSKFIAMTRDKSEYCKLDSLTDCLAIDVDDYICNVMTVSPTSANPSCESELMSKVISVLPVQCQTDSISGTLNVWKPISDNNWIYVQSENIKVYLDCIDQKIIELDVIGTGILKVPQNCVAFCKNTKLIPRYADVKLNVTVFHPTFNIIKDPCCVLDKIPKVRDESPIKLKSIDLDILTSDANSKFNSLLKETDEILNQQPIIKYGTHYSIVLIIMLILMCTYFVIRLYFYIKEHRLSYRFPRPFQSPQNTINAITPHSATPDTVDSKRNVDENSTVTPSNSKTPSREIPLPSIRINV
ncbi:uncharacterized protein LOC121735660 [Aricia agestis]|uniref:uncharacterized protein LOC121735660 n=1 Tax=Aricia agestis TaxID=91739 RepID=UPI001C2085DF|nr:uncharacterized protein LOC121735660 [Aricia agestis]